MINALNPPTPPPMLSNESLNTALIWLAVASDVAGTRARLGELVEQTKLVHSAIAEAEAARDAAVAEQAKLADLHAREKTLDDRQVAVEQMQTQAAVASAALAAREAAQDKRAVELEKLAGDIAAQQAALAAKLASYRKALA
jgi:chromosome segregation ATPase